MTAENRTNAQRSAETLRNLAAAWRELADLADLAADGAADVETIRFATEMAAKLEPLASRIPVHAHAVLRGESEDA